MANKADIDIKDKQGKTALIQACCVGHSEIVKILVANGANMNIKEGVEGQNALIWGTLYNKRECISQIKNLLI